MEIILNKAKWIRRNRRELIKAIQAEDKRSINAKDGEFLFNDLEGNSYYRTAKTYGQSPDRYGKGMEYLMWMSAQLMPEELDELIDAAEFELAKGFKGEKVSTITIGAVFKEIQLRRNMIIHTELLYNYLAVHYIRQDEDPLVFDQKIQDEKVAAFKEIVKNGSCYDFFQVPELRALNEHLKLSRNEWEPQWNASMREQSDLKKRLKLFKYGPRSGNGQGTSAKQL